MYWRHDMELDSVMAEWIFKILVVGFFGWMIWSLLQLRYTFKIRIAKGEAHIQRGKVTRAFLGRVSDACQENGVSGGWIGGVSQGKRTALRFSRQFSPGLQQRLRNEWQASG
jgi:hypothetical protein